MKLRIEKPAVVITPSLGKDCLKKAIDSVLKQTYSNLHHLIVADGQEYYNIIKDMVKNNYFHQNDLNKITISCAPFNTGKGLGNTQGFYGHRIYAGYSHLVNHDYVLFLDDDNWWESNHVQSLVDLCEEKELNFTHSLRKVYTNDKYLADDCCEAIGRWPVVWFGNQYLVDTSSYCFNRDWLKLVAHIWHWSWGGDRRFFMSIKDHARYETTGLHTLNYNLPNMDQAYGGDLNIFERGNKDMLEKFGGKYPWQK